MCIVYCKYIFILQSVLEYAEAEAHQGIRHFQHLLRQDFEWAEKVGLSFELVKDFTRKMQQ